MGFVPKSARLPSSGQLEEQAQVLICARGPATADGHNANYLAAKALIAALKRFAQERSYELIVAKAENARSRDFLRRRGFAILFQRGNPAAMQVATSDITV